MLGSKFTRPPNTDRIKPVGSDGEGNPVYAEEPGEGPSIPTRCLMALHSTRPECPYDCPGRQRDGGCLSEIVRQANADGREWSFEIDREGYWIERSQ